MLTYHRPETIEEALSQLRRASGAGLPYAGGTDLLPRWSKGITPRPEAIVDLKKIGELGAVSRSNGEICIGACVCLSEIESDPTIRSSAPLLSLAAGSVGCPQIRNRATIGGNLSNASPAADTAVPLLLLDAVLDLARAGSDGVQVREVPVADFFRGPGATHLEPGEIVTGIRFRPLPEGWLVAWEKLGTRPAMEIAVASVGLAIKVEDGVVAEARVGYGSVAPVPLRGPKAEAQLVGGFLSDSLIAACVTAAGSEIKPITDVRAGEAYRREVVVVMLRRMLNGFRTSNGE